MGPRKVRLTRAQASAKSISSTRPSSKLPVGILNSTLRDRSRMSFELCGLGNPCFPSLGFPLLLPWSRKIPRVELRIELWGLLFQCWRPWPTAVKMHAFYVLPVGTPQGMHFGTGKHEPIDPIDSEGEGWPCKV